MKCNKFLIIFLTAIITFLASGCADNVPWSWEGKYTFDEFSPPVVEDASNIVWSYTIEIYEKDNGLFANIKVDGFQKTERIHAKIFEESNKINIVFDSYLPENMFGLYKEGDILLSLEKSDSSIITIWGEMKPAILENIASGIYFKKIK